MYNTTQHHHCYFLYYSVVYQRIPCNGTGFRICSGQVSTHGSCLRVFMWWMVWNKLYKMYNSWRKVSPAFCLFFINERYTISVVKCPPISLAEGEMYLDRTCTSNTKDYNDSCKVSCELGYNLTSSDGDHMCTVNATWSNNVTCKRT